MTLLRAVALIAMVGQGAAASAVREVSYTCERGVTLPAAFIFAEGGASIATAIIDGRLIVLDQQVSASGARYVSAGPAPYVLWIKGDTAAVFHGADETMLLSECRAQGAP